MTIDEYVRDEAGKFVQAAVLEDRAKLDYSVGSVAVVNDMIAEAASASVLTTAAREQIIIIAGCYLLEVARGEFGGRYVHHPEHNAPVLVVGSVDRQIALLTYRKVEGRLSGDEADDIGFFFDGFAAKIRGPLSDRAILYL